MGKFLSTPSARRATYWSALNILSYRYFYPRPPRGGRLQKQAFNLQSRIISIHALREEGDARQRTGGILLGISIHALREEGDNVERLFVQERFGHFYPRPPRGGRPGSSSGNRHLVVHFYPRPPRGGRLLTLLPSLMIFTFLSTPSARRATALSTDVQSS